MCMSIPALMLFSSACDWFSAVKCRLVRLSMSIMSLMKNPPKPNSPFTTSVSSQREAWQGIPPMSLCPGMMVMQPASTAALKGGRMYERRKRSEISAEAWFTPPADTPPAARCFTDAATLFAGSGLSCRPFTAVRTISEARKGSSP